MWEQVRSNQIKSAVLVALMGILLLVLGYFLGLIFGDNGIVGVIVALIVWGIMNLVAFFQGDSILLGISGARKIRPDDHPRLYNVVEEMKIASGLEKVPDVYIIDDPALNAFATGRDPNRASVAITSGLLQKLNRDELQGVIGHEVSHIKNRDVLLMVLLSVTLGSIVILAWYASRFMLLSGASGGRSRSSSRGGGGGGAQLIIIAVGIVLMILAPIAAQFIYFAVSRKREYLSDASSALYTRYPEGLASALEKLATSDTNVRAANQATAPMYIINPFQKKGMSINSLTSTHPPIAERIRILRSMAGASLADYERAYHQTKGRGGIISVSALAGAGTMALRAPSPEVKPVEELPEKVERARETSDLMWRLSNYRTISCECGSTLRIPPDFKAPAVRCPHCGRVNHIS
jgi:heat shock protein HtpX